MLALCSALYFYNLRIFDECQEELLSSTYSPNKEKEITIVLLQCGATTSNAIHMRISNIDNKSVETFFIGSNVSIMAVNWNGDADAEIVYELQERGRLFKQQENSLDVSFMYRAD